MMAYNNKYIFAHGIGVLPYAWPPPLPPAAAGGALAYQYPGVVSMMDAQPQLSMAGLPAPGGSQPAFAAAAMPAPAALAAAAPAAAAPVQAGTSVFPSLSKIGSFGKLFKYMEQEAPGGGIAWQQRESQLGSSWRSGKANGKRWAELKAGYAAIMKGNRDGGMVGLQQSASRLDDLRGKQPFAAYVKNVLMKGG